MFMLKRKRFLVSSTRGGIGMVYCHTVLSPRSTEDAIRLSVEKWKTIADWIERNKRLIETPTAGTCALCTLFYGNNPSVPDCTSCPVMKATGQRDCRGSPYRDYQPTLNLYDMRKPKTYSIAVTKTLEVARREELFLRSLLSNK
jgi:hypothetical protein